MVCGDLDRAVPPANSRLLAARIPDARLITIQDGHDLQKPRSAAIVAQLVEQFLDSKGLGARETLPLTSRLPADGGWLSEGSSHVALLFQAC